MVAARICDGSGCGAEAKLRCPKCMNLSIESSFCSQECFRVNWSEHKWMHRDNADRTTASTTTTTEYNPWPNYAFTGELRPFPRTAARAVPEHIKKPDYVSNPGGRARCEETLADSSNIEALDAESIDKMRLSCKLAREVLDEAARITDVGVTTDQIDEVVHEACIERDCYPSPLGYYSFPKSCCTSVNEVICHGIPDKRPLANGDIVNIDITVYHDGFHGDVSETLIVGEAGEQHKRLVRVAWECLQRGIEIVRPGVKYREIGDVIQRHASSHGYSVIKSYCGHGINKLFHTAPKVPHYARNKAVGVIRAGHTFTIEPMIAQGSWRDTSWPDDWTAVTVDGSRCAQFEETILATQTGYEVMTRRRQHNGRPYFMDTLTSTSISSSSSSSE